MSGEGVEFKWTRKRHDIRQAAKRFLEGDEAMNDPAAEENEEDQNYTAECFVSRDAIARSKDDEIARHRDRLHDKVGAAVAERIAGKGSHLVAIVDTAWPDNDLRALGLRTKAYITDIPGAIEQRQRLKDTEAALAAAAEQLRAVMEANEKLRKQLSDQASEISMLNAEAEMWQQRAEMAEREVARVNERLAAAEKLNALASEFTFYKRGGGSVVFNRTTLLSGGFFWYAEKNPESPFKNIGKPFDTFDECYADAVAANWLPPAEAKQLEGGG